MTIPRRVLVISVVMIVLTTAPYLTALISAPGGSTFRGAILDLSDYNSHLAKMQQGAQGAWLYQLLFTAEPHEPALLQTFYVALGHLVRLTGLSFDLVYQLARIVCVALMVLTMWAFISHYLPVNAAWWALLLALFAGGMSYLLLFFDPAATQNISPIEFWLLDAYTFLAAFVSPHFALGIALLATVFLSLDRWTAGDGANQLLLLFVASLVLIFIQPFDALLVDPALVIITLWRVRRGKIAWSKALAGLTLIGISHFTLVAYDWIVLYHFPIWQSFTEQNALLSPPPIYYLLGFAPTLLPAIGGIVVAIRRRDTRWVVPMIWLLAVAILVYAPVAQRRFLLGVQIPLAMLTVYWLAEAAVPWLRRYLKQRYRLVLTVYGALTTLSTVTVFVWLIASTRNPANQNIYVSQATVNAWQWIGANTSVQSVVLSGEQDGNNIPARTGRRVVLGHAAETINVDVKRANVQHFFSADTSDDWRKSLLSDQRVTYIWYGAEEQALGQWSPQTAPYLQLVFQDSDVAIYQVQPDGAA